jgi:glycosyltransferase involved in cell wall biosynthesis
MGVTAIIPAFNEEARIGETIGGLLRVAEITEIIVVDDGSIDQTAQIGKLSGAHRVISLPQNIGKGGALARGVKAAQYDILCFVDADLGASAAEFATLLTPVLRGEVDMTVARFPAATRPAGIGLVKRLAVWGIERLSGYIPASPLSGQRVLKRIVWDKAICARDGFGVEVGLTVDCVRQGFTMREIPVKMHHRETGRDLQGFRHRGRQFVQVSRTLWRLWTNRRVKL